jgi:hypothetical protein
MEKSTDMKKLYLLALTAAVVGLVAAPDTFARDKTAGKKKDKVPTTQTVASDVYVRYDLNSNGILDDTEKATLIKDFTANSSDMLLKPFDTNNDGKLSNDEIATIPATKTVDVPAPVKEKKHKKNK